MKHKMQILGN